MKKYRLFISIIATLMILILGGCGMTESNKEVKYKEEQDRMVEYLAQNYEGVEKIEFINFEENIKTGYYTSIAKIDDKFEVMFYERGADGEISLDYYTRDFIAQYPKITKKTISNFDIKVVYYGE
ncbi:DUF1433 domain-containing protein [Streptococcus suis]|uniref:DUF1433 domain-containing protein n=1 Tax=Streptococcus suis TaxID=1307 RepID=UPI001FC9B683